MSTSFTNITAQGIGSTPVTVYSESSSGSVLIGCNIANITAGSLPISVILKKSEVQTYIVKNTKIESGGVYEVLQGSKLVLTNGDQIIAVSNTDEAFDIILSLLTGANE